MSECSPRIHFCKQNSECLVRKLQNQDENIVMSVSSKMELFLECAFLSLQGVADRSEFTS